METERVNLVDYLSVTLQDIKYKMEEDVEWGKNFCAILDDARDHGAIVYLNSTSQDPLRYEDLQYLQSPLKSNIISGHWQASSKNHPVWGMQGEWILYNQHESLQPGFVSQTGGESSTFTITNSNLGYKGEI